MNVYVMASDGGVCKIGRARVPENRLEVLRTGHPWPISVFREYAVDDKIAPAVERKAHWLLADRRLSGEWFKVTPTWACQAVEAAIVDQKIDDASESNGQRQRAHRQRRAAERQRMIDKLEAIVVKTATAKKEMGQTVHALALEGLGRAAATADKVKP